MWTRKKQLPTPFQNGSLTSVLLGTVATVIMIYFYLAAEPDQSSKYLLFIVIGLAGTVRSLFSYRRKRIQNNLDLLNDPSRPNV